MKTILVDPDNINWRQARRFVIFAGVVCAFLYFLSAVYQALLVPFGVSLLLTYLLAPVVEKFARFRVSRIIVVSGLLGITLGGLAFATVKIIPALYTEVLDLIRMLPQVYEVAVSKWLPSVKDFLMELDLMAPVEFDRMVEESRDLVHMSERVQQALTTLWYTAPRVLGTMVNFVMTPLITFFLLKDYNLIRSSLLQMVPRDLLAPSEVFLGRVGDTLSAVIKGQVTVAAVLAFLYVVGLSVVGLQAAWAIGLIAGLCRIIPYLDVLVGGSLSLVVLLSDFQGMGQVLAVAAVFLIVQALDGMFITPRIIGERVGLHPLVVIVSVISFGDLFGFWGILLAIPIIAIAKVLWLSVKPFYLASTAYDVNNDKPRQKGRGGRRVERLAPEETPPQA